MSHFLIFANGDLNPGDAVDQALAQPATVIAADGGTRWAFALGYTIDVLIGDMDSILPENLAKLQASDCVIQQHPVDKNETDLELALQEAAHRGATSIAVIGALGGRLDQMLANIYLLNLSELAHIPTCLYAGNQTTRLLKPGSYDIAGQIDDTVSLIPVGGDVIGISTRGMRYPLDNETLYFGPARGVSNRIAQIPAAVEFSQGKLLMIHTIGKA